MTAPAVDRPTQQIPQIPSDAPGVTTIGYRLSSSDRALVADAAATFASDWRYLLDMVTAANRTATRTATRSARTASSQKSPESLSFSPPPEAG